MAEKKHKCEACCKIRLERYMMPDFGGVTKSGKQKYKWYCGDCEEENRGRKYNSYIKTKQQIKL